MDPCKSIDYISIITTMLSDVQTLHSSVFTPRACRLTQKVVERRVASEGIGFLTKTLPRLAKAFDKALADHEPLDASKLAFKSQPGSKLPKLFGELFNEVLDTNGVVQPATDVACVKSLRQLMYLFYKLELPFDPKQEEEVLQKFKETDENIISYNDYFGNLCLNIHRTGSREALRALKEPEWFKRTIRNARRGLAKVFEGFDHRDIYPRHGPGAVSTGEKLWGKYQWTNIPSRITDVYPADEYYYSSLGHVCDALQELNALSDRESFAKVILVPKDSRGPRLISCEPLEFQWIQQGLGRAIMRKIESHSLTKWSIRFTNQQPNRLGALLGSQRGKYATLDLSEASDRVSLGLVTVLFPETVKTALMATRSLGTMLPSGENITLNKFAPMGSALCFPILATTVFAVLFYGLQAIDADVLPEDVLVYGDDVVVPGHLAQHAMNILESFGLKVNRDKSCTKGFFRESCGLDAYKGVDVTPVRFRTPWSSLRRPDVYTSWISYANSMWRRKFYQVYELIVGRLHEVYDFVPTKAYGLSVPSLTGELEHTSVKPRSRWNKHLQKREFLVRDVVPVSVSKTINGWYMLLRYFSEGCSAYELSKTLRHADAPDGDSFMNPFSVREYTLRKRSNLRFRWR